MSTGLVKLKHSDIPRYRDAILKQQGGVCAICGTHLSSRSKKKPALDHSHSEGYLRGVLCLMCNQAEGRIKTWVTRAKGDKTELEWLAALYTYLNKEPKYRKYIHPTHKTEAEKRLVKNKQAREKRAALKEK